MKGPHAPFEGKAGWCDHVAGKRFSLATLGGGGDAVQDPRHADQAARVLRDDDLVDPRRGKGAPPTSPRVGRRSSRVTVEVYERAKIGMGTGEHHWNPDSRETADHSIPVRGRGCADRQARSRPRRSTMRGCWSPELRALLPKIEVVANDEFTAPTSGCRWSTARASRVAMRGGERVIGEAGGDKGDLSQPKSDARDRGEIPRAHGRRRSARSASNADARCAVEAGTRRTTSSREFHRLAICLTDHSSTGGRTWRRTATRFSTPTRTSVRSWKCWTSTSRADGEVAAAGMGAVTSRINKHGNRTYNKGQRIYRRRLGEAKADQDTRPATWRASPACKREREPSPRVDHDPAERIKDMDYEGVDVNLDAALGLVRHLDRRRRRRARSRACTAPITAG